jgi:hypothetical protein
VKIKILARIVAMLCASLIGQAQSVWQQKVKEELPLLGHRSWIVIVDSAYTLQTSPGVETIETGANQMAVVDYVIQEVKNSTHVRPLVHTDKELEFVPENEAPGMARYRKELNKRIAGLPADSLIHEALIDKLGEAGKTFHVLVLKARLAISYTTLHYFCNLTAGIGPPSPKLDCAKG